MQHAVTAADVTLFGGCSDRSLFDLLCRPLSGHALTMMKAVSLIKVQETFAPIASLRIAEPPNLILSCVKTGVVVGGLALAVSATIHSARWLLETFWIPSAYALARRWIIRCLGDGRLHNWRDQYVNGGTWFQEVRGQFATYLMKISEDEFDRRRTQTIMFRDLDAYQKQFIAWFEAESVVTGDALYMEFAIDTLPQLGKFNVMSRGDLNVLLIRQGNAYCMRRTPQVDGADRIRFVRFLMEYVDHHTPLPPFQ